MSSIFFLAAWSLSAALFFSLDENVPSANPFLLVEAESILLIKRVDPGAVCLGERIHVGVGHLELVFHLCGGETDKGQIDLVTFGAPSISDFLIGYLRPRRTAMSMWFDISPWRTSSSNLAGDPYWLVTDSR